MARRRAGGRGGRLEHGAGGPPAGLRPLASHPGLLPAFGGASASRLPRPRRLLTGHSLVRRRPRDMIPPIYRPGVADRWRRYCRSLGLTPWQGAGRLALIPWRCTCRFRLFGLASPSSSSWAGAGTRPCGPGRTRLEPPVAHHRRLRSRRSQQGGPLTRSRRIQPRASLTAAAGATAPSRSVTVSGAFSFCSFWAMP